MYFTENGRCGKRLVSPSLKPSLRYQFLQRNVLSDDANADGLNRSRPGVFEDVLDEASTDSAVAMRWKYG